MKMWTVLAGLVVAQVAMASAAHSATAYDRCYAYRKAKSGPVVAAFECWKPKPVTIGKPVVYRKPRPTEWDICVNRNQRRGMNAVSAAFACTGKKMW
jgi:hypothetical protein